MWKSDVCEMHEPRHGNFKNCGTVMYVGYMSLVIILNFFLKTLSENKIHASLILYQKNKKQKK